MMNFKSRLDDLRKAGVPPKSGLQIDAPRTKEWYKDRMRPRKQQYSERNANGGRDRNVGNAACHRNPSMISEITYSRSQSAQSGRTTVA
jgi:hypothetical protein